MDDNVHWYRFGGFINGKCCSNQMKIDFYNSYFNLQFTFVESNQGAFNVLLSILIIHEHIVSNYPQNKWLITSFV